MPESLATLNRVKVILFGSLSALGLNLAAVRTRFHQLCPFRVSILISCGVFDASRAYGSNVRSAKQRHALLDRCSLSYPRLEWPPASDRTAASSRWFANLMLRQTCSRLHLGLHSPICHLWRMGYLYAAVRSSYRGPRFVSDPATRSIACTTYFPRAVQNT